MKVLIDLFNLLHVCFSIAKTQAYREKGSFTDEDVGLYYHKVLDSLISYTKTYGQIVFCNEGKNSLEWRRKIFPEYKTNRKHDETYQIFKDHLNDVKELISYFPCKTIEVAGAEGDDIMYSLATYFADEGEDVTVVSGDRDMAQLINHSDKIKVFNPVTKTYREQQKDLILEKAIVGDASDNIPGVYKIGIKTYQKCLANRNLWDEKIAPHKDEINKFIQIIDLSKAPEYIKKEAIIQYNSADFNNFDPDSVEKFMIDHKLKEHLSKWQNDVTDIELAITDSSVDIDTKTVELTDMQDVDDFLNFVNNL